MTSSSPIPHITDETRAAREKRAASLVLAGKSVPEIAEELFGSNTALTRNATWQITQSEAVCQIVARSRLMSRGAH